MVRAYPVDLHPRVLPAVASPERYSRSIGLPVLEESLVNGITLVIISPLKGLVHPNGKIVLTEKFVDGMRLYSELWDGPILHLCEPAEREGHNLDNVEVEIAAPTFDTICAKLTDDHLCSVLPKRSLVITSVGEQFNSVSTLCRRLGVPCVYVTEYTLKTRLQIISEYQKNAIYGTWQKLRQAHQEISQRRAMSIAAGVQCNGLPTFRAYKGLSQSTHLFFDTRTEGSMLAKADQVTGKRFAKQSGEKLRLTFSGRLTLMKGVDDLLVVASHLRGLLNDRFELSICGDGDYADQLRQDILQNGLSDLVKTRGNLDFKTELLPFLKNETDMFVCCHRQGDPSCTYLETMACGVPIIGYANEAWSQLSDHARAGWVVRNGDAAAMANKIAKLDQSPDAIETEGVKSLRFAAEHTFETTFQRRVDHFKTLVGNAGPGFAS
jgi:colanic acid/amylovoran biosynthesis glycosyltransferase